jgi:hypothetical protein
MTLLKLTDPDSIIATMIAAARKDALLSTLNAADVGSLESIASKIDEVRRELQELDKPELVARADAALEALRRGDLAEFQRARAFLQSKIGHLR